jgi:8-oxo-dGTP diphosphatase
VIHLSTGIAIRDRRLLMVASRYPNQPLPLWNLPGGRQLPGELLAETVVREVFEETGLHVEAGEIAYVSESYDGSLHYLNVTFVLSLSFAEGVGVGVTREDGDHIAGVQWVPLAEVGERVAVAVVREPLLAYLGGTLTRRYAGFHEAGITIEWPANSQ